MPIYAYRCADCGHAQDVLQKMSDPLLTVCPACGKESYQKQLTAAGFQLKGSGWYVTDFREGNKGKPDEAKADAKADGTDAGKAADQPAATSEGKSTDGQSAGQTGTSGAAVKGATGGTPSSASTSATPSPAPAAAVAKPPVAAPQAAPRSGS